MKVKESIILLDYSAYRDTLVNAIEKVVDDPRIFHCMVSYLYDWCIARSLKDCTRATIIGIANNPYSDMDYIFGQYYDKIRDIFHRAIISALTANKIVINENETIKILPTFKSVIIARVIVETDPWNY